MATVGGLLAAPLAAQAQSRGKTWRVGFLSGSARPPDDAVPLSLRQALQELGYVEQQNVVYLGRWAEAKQDRLPGLAAELVGLKVDVIVTTGGPASGAAKRATSSIPIVLAQVGDADGLGLIESLARPGGNVTGVTDQSVELSAKRLTALNRKRVIDFALVHRIPAMYEFSFLVRDGGLMSYGANQDDNYRKVASYVDRIFKGAAPSSLPVERPGRYYLTINLKTAKALGLALPQSLLLRADQVIE